MEQNIRALRCNMWFQNILMLSDIISDYTYFAFEDRCGEMTKFDQQNAEQKL